MIPDRATGLCLVLETRYSHIGIRSEVMGGSYHARRCPLLGCRTTRTEHVHAATDRRYVLIPGRHGIPRPEHHRSHCCLLCTDI
jgi:hypothetical protein